MSLINFDFFSFLYIPFALCFTLITIYMYVHFVSLMKRSLPGCIVLIVVMAPIIYEVNIVSNMKEDYYFHTKTQLPKAPIVFPEYIRSSNTEKFTDAISKYGNAMQRCFYFDLQWSIRYSSSQKEKEKYQALERVFLQSKSRLHAQQILAYKLHEVLLADSSRDSILHYFKELHPGNIYNTDIYFERISKTINLVTATLEQEHKIVTNNKIGGRRYGLSPRTLSQAIVNSTCFTMDEKTEMIEYIIKCYMELALYNNCPKNYLQDYKTKIFDDSDSDYHISQIKDSAWSGSSYIEEKISQLMTQMRESNPNWSANYNPKNWEIFTF